MLAILIRVLGDFDLAEDAVQDAFATGARALAARRRPGEARAPGSSTTARNRGDRPAPPRADARAQDRAARAAARARRPRRRTW